MVFNLRTYLKVRQITSTYPSIDEKPDSKAIKTLRKVRAYLLSKCVTVFSVVPLVLRPGCRDGVIDDFEILGKFYFLIISLGSRLLSTLFVTHIIYLTSSVGGRVVLFMEIDALATSDYRCLNI